MARPQGPSRAEERRWKAENIVNDAMRNTPAYKKAVNQAIKDIQAAEQNARKTMK